MNTNKKNLVPALSNTELLFRSVLGFFIIVLTIVGLDFSMQIKKIQEIAVSIECISTMNAQVQRLVRMEVTYEYNDGLIYQIDSTIEQLSNVDHFILTQNNEFTDTFGSVIENWQNLKNEIYLARQNGWHSTRILYASETVFYSIERLSIELMDYFIYLPSLLALLQFFIFGIIGLILLWVIIRCIRYVSVISKQKQQVQESYIDPATNLYNRGKCQELLVEKLAHDNSILILCDLNNLKIVNDSLGHDYGDLLIKSFAHALISAQQEVSQNAFIGRYGGDEFIIYFEHIESTNLSKFYDVLHKSIQKFNDSEVRFKIQFAFGQAYSYEVSSAETIGDLFKLADERMYINKIEVKKNKNLIMKI